MSDDELDSVYVGGRPRLNGKITLSEYDPAWPTLFEREAQRIRGVLGPIVRQLDHVGSTSIPGIAAKPRIDIVLAVPDSADEPAYVPALEAAGYTLRIREPDWFEHRLLNGPDTDINLHVFSAGCPEIDKMRTFRDWVRTHESDRLLYERTKRELGARTWQYTQDYADAKADVVHEILRRAGWQAPTD